MMNGSSRHLTSKQVFTWMMVLSFVFFLLPQRWTDKLDHFFSALVGPFSKSSRQMTLLVTENLPQPGQPDVSAQQYYKLQERLFNAEKERINLLQANHDLQEALERISGVRQKFGQARALLIDASVIAGDSTNWRYCKKLNQGSLHHIAEGQIVLGPMASAVKETAPDSIESLCQMCVVGRINNVGLNYSSLQLINDAGFRWPVVIEPNPNRGEVWRANGVLKVKSLGEISVTMVEERGHPVRVGDSVLACSDPRYLPVETLLGTVKLCERDKGNPLMWHIMVEPAADLHSLNNVLVVNTLWEE
jgi:cell shape-determining protein MreC